MTKKRKNKEDQPIHTVCYRRLCSVDELKGTLDKSDDQFMVHENVVYEKIAPEGIHIDLNSIPEHMRNDLAAATLDFVRRMMREPSTRELIEKKVKNDAINSL